MSAKEIVRTGLVAVGCAWVLVGLFMLFAGCSRNAQTEMANDARVVGEEAASLLHEGCTMEYAMAKTPERIEDLDAYCIPARKAYDVYRAAWAGLVTVIGRNGSDLEVADQAKEIVHAAEELGKAIAAIPKEAP